MPITGLLAGSSVDHDLFHLIPDSKIKVVVCRKVIDVLKLYWRTASGLKMGAHGCYVGAIYLPNFEFKHGLARWLYNSLREGTS